MRRSLVNQSTIAGGILALVGAGALLAALGIKLDPDGGFGARTFPFMAAGAILILGLLELIKGARQVASGEAGVDRKALVQILLFLGLSLFYVWGMGKFGYLLSTALAAPLALILFGIRRPVGLIAAAVLCPAVYHLLFFVGLGVFPPAGEWIDLLDILRE